MYVQGVSTRKVAAILEELCGTSVSSTHVSHGAARLDAELEAGAPDPSAPFLMSSSMPATKRSAMVAA